MKAVCTCANTNKLIEERKQIKGSVHSIFNRTCNIITEDNLLIALISSKIPNAPRSISFILPQDRDFYSFGLEKGMPFVLNEEMIVIGDNQFKIDLSKQKIWDPNLILDFKGAEEKIVLQNISYLKEVLLEKGNFDGIAPIFMDLNNYIGNCDEDLCEIQMNHYCTFIYSKLQKLIELLLEEDIEGIEKIIKQVIGFGPGLTPSADDFLTGLMISMLYGGIYFELDLDKIFRINRAIADKTAHRTTKVSEEMLKFAAVGQVSDHIRSLMVNIFSNEDKSQLLKNICSVIDTGETSGSDLIAGAYIGLMLILHNRRESKEQKCI